MEALLMWLRARIMEPSTLRGIVGALTAVGISVEPDMINAILTAGISVVAVINIFKKDCKNSG